MLKAPTNQGVSLRSTDYEDMQRALQLSMIRTASKAFAVPQ